MPERHFFDKLKNNISQYVVLEKIPQFAIDASYAFLQDNSVDEWKRVLKEWQPEKRLSLRSIVTQALKNDKYERLELVKDMCESRGIAIKTGKDAKNKLEETYKQIQVKINIFSMSDVNIENLAAALEIEVEVD